MLDNLWKAIETLVLEANPFEIVDEMEGGILLRGGKFNRPVFTGINFRIPFLDKILTTSLAEVTIDLPTQSLLTKDDKDAVIGGVLRFRVRDPKIYLLYVEDPLSVIKDTVMRETFRALISKTLCELRDEQAELAEEISFQVSLALYRYGIDVDMCDGFTFSDIAKTRNIRLMQDLAYKGVEFEE